MAELFGTEGSQSGQTGEGNITGNAWTSAMGDIQAGSA